jgi:hypothetical protein
VSTPFGHNIVYSADQLAGLVESALCALMEQ